MRFTLVAHYGDGRAERSDVATWPDVARAARGLYDGRGLARTAPTSVEVIDHVRGSRKGVRRDGTVIG